MQVNATPATQADTVKLHGEAMYLMNSLSDTFSNSEMRFFYQGIKSQSLPTPQLLSIDHKTPTTNGDWPTRLVIPVVGFIVNFAKLGYKGIQRLFEANCIVYNIFTI